MGSVFLADDTQLERPVALKVPGFGANIGPEGDGVLRPRRARTAATLEHPYLCPAYHAGEIDGQLYFTMAYIEGKSLEALIGEPGWPPRQVAALVGKLALAMQEAHAQKVIHRDLKPANVMIKTTGERREPVIVEFGLAHRDNPDEVRFDPGPVSSWARSATWPPRAGARPGSALAITRHAWESSPGMPAIRTERPTRWARSGRTPLISTICTEMFGNGAGTGSMTDTTAIRPSPIPMGPSEATFRAGKGKSFGGDPRDFRPAHRYGRLPSWRFNNHGFRVARVRSGP